MRKRIPKVGFLDAYLRTLTFQSLYRGFTNKHYLTPLLKLTVEGYKVVRVRKYARKFFVHGGLLSIMERRYSEPDIQSSQIKIVELRKVGGDPVKPDYAGKMETPHGVLEFVTRIDCLESGQSYDAVYEFTENWMGDIVAQIREVKTIK